MTGAQRMADIGRMMGDRAKAEQNRAVMAALSRPGEPLVGSWADYWLGIKAPAMVPIAYDRAKWDRWYRAYSEMGAA